MEAGAGVSCDQRWSSFWKPGCFWPMGSPSHPAHPSRQWWASRSRMRSSRHMPSPILRANPGRSRAALINFGDGRSDGPVIPVEHGEDFEFVDTHTYNAPGVYTVRVMIAVPGSQEPNDNTVTTQVTVTSSTAAPTPIPPPSPPTSPPSPPTSPPSPPRLAGSGLNTRVREHRTFHGTVARFSEPHTKATQFQAIINWGDQSAPTPGLVRARGRGRFIAIGTHRYVTPGTFNVAVKIEDGSGQEIVTESLMRVVK